MNTRARRRTTAAGLTMAVVLAVAGGVSVVIRRASQPATLPAPPVGGPSDPTGSGAPSTSAYAPPTYRANAPPPYPADGPGTFVYASGDGPVHGSAGPVHRFRVAIETGAPVPPTEFTALIDATLGDPRSWIGGRDVRLQRVAGQSDFTIYLATPGTAYRLCRTGGVDIRHRGEPYTSCRIGPRIVINLARYMTGVPGYGASLHVYRQYAINHEIGHALGHGHELCPGRGRQAPVMQQQTLGLRGCVAYAWPYRAGRRYAGPPGEV